MKIILIDFKKIIEYIKYKHFHQQSLNKYMKDQERQALNLQGKYQHFNIFLNYDSDHEKLNIRVENTITLEEYNQCVDSSFIEKRPELVCLVDPVNIFDFLTENLSTVSFEEGVLRFLYVWGKAKKKQKQIKIQLVKKAMSELQLANMRNIKLNQQLISKDCIIRDLMQAVNDLKKQIQQQKCNNQLFKTMLNEESRIFSKEKTMFLQKIASLQGRGKSNNEEKMKQRSDPFGGSFGKSSGSFQFSPQIVPQKLELQQKRKGPFSRAGFN